MNFYCELKKIEKSVGRIISRDDYPEKIRPHYLRRAVRDYPAAKGKRLRPALLMWSCGLFGGNPETAKFAAASVEIYHNWTLVHDDIIDRGRTRRGAPAAHVKLANFAKNKFSLSHGASEKFGSDFAMLAGDVQQGWAADMLLKSEKSGVSLKLCVFLSRKLHELVNRELISGEALDTEFPLHDWDSLSEKSVRKMLCLKTGALLRFCAETGALIALKSAKPADYAGIEKIGRFAALAGVAFQLRDDWLGVFGNEKKLGKPVGSDLSEQKPTLMLLAAWRKMNVSERKKLSAFLGKTKYTRKEIGAVREIIVRTGADKIILNRAEKLADSAKNILISLPNNKYRALLLEWTDYLLGRNK